MYFVYKRAAVLLFGICSASSTDLGVSKCSDISDFDDVTASCEIVNKGSGELGRVTSYNLEAKID